MNKKLSFDIGVITPILLGAFSLLGICVVLGMQLYKGERPPLQAVATETPFRYIYLGTEPGLSTLTPEATDTPEATPTLLPPPVLTLPSDNGSGQPSEPVINPTQTPVKATAPANPTITPTIPAVLSKVDDTYFEILYDGDWVAQANVSGAHQNTLHISFTAGNAALFTFVGQKVIVSYQAGPSLGTININLDGSDFTVNQSNSDTEIKDWNSPILLLGTHTLLVEHLSGGSVNLDAITIPDISTPTPTPAP